jgi:uncharacterized alkaline shock family protein YloU
MNTPELIVGPSVVLETIRLAALGVPGVVRVGRSGGRLRGWLDGPAIAADLSPTEATQVRISIVARPATSLRGIAGGVHSAIRMALEGQLGLTVGTVLVTIDGIGN